MRKSRQGKDLKQVSVFLPEDLYEEFVAKMEQTLGERMVSFGIRLLVLKFLKGEIDLI